MSDNEFMPSAEPSEDEELIRRLQRVESWLRADVKRADGSYAVDADVCALAIARLRALKRDNAYMGYVVHGPLLPQQEARATKIERDALRADNERLRSPPAAPEYTREEMREACRNNYHAGAAVGADLAAQVAQLRADVAAMGNALADYFDNGSDYSTGAKVRAIAERQGAKNG